MSAVDGVGTGGFVVVLIDDEKTVLDSLRARFPRIGRIMLTGQADRDALERARNAAAAHRILFKPWRPDELRAAINDAAAVAR